MNACEVKARPDRIVSKTLRRLFLTAYPFCAKPDCCCCPASQYVGRVIAALRGRLLLYILYACKVERLIALTILKERSASGGGRP